MFDSPSRNPTNQQDKQDAQATTRGWLANLGFRFNPFQYLEASTDPNLGEYIVGHDHFAVAWDQSPSLIFAPAGGGKTAMRIYVTRACWVGLGGAHPFPIPYLPSRRADGDSAVSEREHLHGIVRAGVSALLIGLAYRPELLQALDEADRIQLIELLDNALPGSLPRYLDILRSEQTPLALLPVLEKSYRLPNPPSWPALRDLCAALDQVMAQPARPLSPEEQFERLVALLLGPLGFRSIFLLIDGVDAVPETIAEPAAMVDWIAWPLRQIGMWAERRIFLKCFLPEETTALVTNYLLPAHSQVVRQAHLQWTPALLADVIRRRVYVASGGEFGSLDAISSPALRDVETYLLRSTIPLPREGLALVSLVLEAYRQRTGGVAGQLETEDLETALDWYKTSRAYAVYRS